MSPFSVKSQFPTDLWVSLNISPTVFQSWTSWGLVSPVHVLKVGIPNVEHELLPPQEEVPCLWDSSQWMVATRGVGFLARTSLPLLSVLMWTFYPLLWRSCSVSSQVFFKGNCSTCSCGFDMCVEGNEFRIFLCHHLVPPIGLCPINLLHLVYTFILSHSYICLYIFK